VEIAVRPLRADDIDAARAVQTRSFEAYDRAHGKEVPAPTEESMSRQRTRFQHFLTHDPSGSWVATLDDAVVGVALALRRDGLWGLSLLAVDPELQSRGAGRRLLEASLEYATTATTAIILSSEDPRAMRAYATSGFDLHPQVEASGAVDRSLLPRVDGRVRSGGGSWAEWADAIDRQVRGAARGPDHALICATAEMFVIDDVDGRGYAYVRNDGRIVTVAATDDDTAAALLWQCLATDHAGDRSVSHINGAQQWAIRVALSARLRLKPSGPVFWRGRLPPTAYLPDGAYL
jgi:predicted N-acetyltransferase YhbS